ncbi:retrovirus-related pol polyprotein from transposon TNT 1-94 [Tanacetum coccineum]
MSTQQDIYAAGSKNRPLMLNKDNYVPWSIHLLRYAKSKPNRKLLVNSILHAESTHEQTNDELTENEEKKMEADNQAIHNILMGLPEDIYAAVDSCNTVQENLVTCSADDERFRHWGLGEKDPTTAMNMELVLMATTFKLNYFAPTNNNQRISSSPGNKLIAQSGMNMGQDRQMPMVEDNDGNQFRQIGNVVEVRAEGNGIKNNGNQIRCYNCRGVGHYARNCTEEAGVQLQAEEFDLMAAAAKNEEIEEVNVNLNGQFKANDSNVTLADSRMDPSGRIVEQHPATIEETCAFYESLYNNLVIEVEKVNMVNRKMIEANVKLTVELARYKGQEKCFEFNQAKFNELENGYRNNTFKKEFLKEVAKFVRDFKSLAKETDESLDKIMVLEKDNECLLRSVVSQDIMSVLQILAVVDTSNLQTELEPYNDMQHQIELLQAQLGDLKGKSMNTQCPSNTLDSLSQKLDDENVSLEFQLVVPNDKSEVGCATCKQCLVTTNHDECVFKYVNGMNFSKKNQSANVSESANQKKHKANVKKSKNLGSKERLASPRPSKPRTCLKWLPNVFKTPKAEYVSLSACGAIVLWMQIQMHVEKALIELYFVKTDYQLADIFTKALPAERFNYLVYCIGMCNLSP